MGGQNLERRRVLEVFSLAASASLFPGFSRWSFADPEGVLGDRDDRQTRLPGRIYQPQFFSASEYNAIVAITERIIPTDDTPGAREAGVSEFIDFMVFSDTSLQESFRDGLAWLRELARKQYAREFAELHDDHQDGILASLADPTPMSPVDPTGSQFFELVREYTVMGFYTSRVGMEQLGNPQLSSYYEDVPGCPHLDDPEHRHLSRSRLGADQ